MKKRIAKVVAGTVAGVGIASSQAMAAVDLTGVTMDTTTVEALAGTVLIGLGVIWGIRKLIKLSNRS